MYQKIKMLILLFIPWLSFTQIDTLVLKQRIDSLQDFYYDYSNEHYQQYHTILKQSKSINYHQGVLRSRIELVDYFGQNQNLDSLSYHSKEFEKYVRIYPDQKLEKSYNISMGYALTYYFSLPDHALGYLVKAYEMEYDPFDKATLHLCILDCYGLKNQYQKIIEIGEQLLQENLFNKDTHPDLFYRLKFNLLFGYHGLKNVEKSIPLITSLENYLLDYQGENKNNALAYMKLQKGYSYYLQDRPQKAIDFLKTNRDFVSVHWENGLCDYYEYLALSYAELKDYKKAVNAMKRSFKDAVYNQLPKLYSITSSYYKALDKKDSALYYLELRDQLVDSIRAVEERIYVDHFETKKENIDIVETSKVISKENKVLLQKNTSKAWYLLTCGIFLLFAALICLWLIKRYKATQKKATVTKKEKERLRTKIAIKNHKITASLVRQEQRLDQLKNIKQAIDTHLQSNKNELIKKDLNVLGKFIAKGIAKDDVINELIYQNEELVTVLKQERTKLSKTDLAHCILIYREVNIKDSAAILYINTNTVRTARYRAKSKLGLSKEQSFAQFLGQLVLEKSDVI